MKPKLNSTPAENREHAFLLWYSCGMNDSEAVRQLTQESFSVTRQTITAWKKKYGWLERAAALDALKVKAADTSLTFEEELLQDLKRQKARYDSFFETLPPNKVDNQAMYVYSQLCKHILDLTSKYKPKQAKVRKGLTAESAQDIKNQILGLKH